MLQEFFVFSGKKNDTLLAKICFIKNKDIEYRLLPQ